MHKIDVCRTLGFVHRLTTGLAIGMLLRLATAGQAGQVENASQAALFDGWRGGIVHIGETKKDDAQIIERWLGTGFLIDGNCTFATAKHIFHNADKGRIATRIQNPQNRSTVITRPAKVIYEDKNSDIAFIRTGLINEKPCASGSLHVFALFDSLERELLGGESILIIGHPVISNESVDVPVARGGSLLQQR